MFSRILIANRGEIACRIIRTAHRMGVECVAVYSDADARSQPVRQADAAVYIGKSAPLESYLNADAIINAALRTGAQAIHPGYGFLSENPEFVEAVNQAGLVFIGPPASAIRAMGLKDAAKSLMENAGVPVVPGYHGENQSADYLAEQAAAVGYPVLIKARAGGGGKGMRLVNRAEDFASSLASAAREAQASFADAAVLIEKYITSPRHIEVQVLGDSHGDVVHLFERDCSLQRRHQKVIEEAPAPGMTAAMRTAMTDAAVTAAKAIDYCGAGTIEFIVDGSDGLKTDAFWFMEMNTRLQVEHPVTESITGIDLVEMQLRVAFGEALPFSQSDLQIKGHAFEARLYAEDVPAGFLPATGIMQAVIFDQRGRVDSGVTDGDTITPFYDPMIAKLITHESTRAEALAAMSTSLRHTHIAGTVTNNAFLLALCEHPAFREAKIDTGLIDRELAVLTRLPDICDSTRLLAIVVALSINVRQPLCGWRHFGSASKLVRMHEGSREIQRRLLVSANGHLRLEHAHQSGSLAEIKVLDINEHSIRYEESGLVSIASIVRWTQGNTVKVSVSTDGHCHEFVLDDPRDSADVTTGDENSLIAPMTGVIRLINARPGDSVSAGDPVVVMEAMKMESSVLSPRSGVVKSLHCSVGDTVDGGSALVRLEAEQQEA